MMRPPDKLLFSCHCSSSRIFKRQKNLPIEFHTWCKNVKLYASHLHLIQEGGIANLVQDPDRGSDSRHSEFLFWVHDFLPGESQDVLFDNTHMVPVHALCDIEPRSTLRLQILTKTARMHWMSWGASGGRHF